MSQSLDDILSNSAQPAAQEPVTESADAAKGDIGLGENFEDENGESESAENETEAQAAAESTATSAETDDTKGLKAALKAERQKRQALERQMQAPAPAGYSDDIDRFEHTMRELNDDYDDTMKHFYDHVENEDDGSTLDELNSAKNPVTYAYKKGKEISEAKKAKEAEEAKTKEEALRAQIRAEVEAEYRKQSTDSYPPTLPSGGAPAQSSNGAKMSLSGILQGR